MIAEASVEIGRAESVARNRRAAWHQKQDPIRHVDIWLRALEDLIAHDTRSVPEPLYREINTFVWGMDSRLFDRLGWTSDNDAIRILDKMFVLQELLLPRHRPHS